ncbi:MAG: DUF4347 domain-containing protein, partial [Candidatus Accumulibacter sp.]|nr:DUF4347 domain-containing protein [Accumulibacter sp.]
MTTAIRQVAFIDSRITDHQTVLAELAREAEWFVLDADEDGIEQMARILAGYRKLDAIQVFSHGSPGTLYLGSTVLNSGNLADYESRFAAVGTSLTETGDILLYGCNVAQGDHGLQFINSLAQATGADVAASTDLTGSAVLGGNWALEASAGTIEAETQIDLPPAVGSAATQQTASISINGNGSADVGHRASSDVEAFSLAFAGTIAADGIWRTGNLISAGAIEWFAITLQESGLYNFYAEETGFIGGIDPQIRIADSGGNTVNNLLAIPSGANAIFGNTELLGVSGLSGTFYVEIRDIDFDGAGFFDSANDTGPYRIRVDTVADDAGSTAATASTALNADGSWLSKTINTPNDVDWFKLTLDATNLYTFRVEETGSIGGLDPQLRIVDSAGNTVNGLLAVPDGLNTPLGNAELVGVSGLSGTYYLEIRDIDYDGAGILDDANDAGPYRVSAETIADDAGSTAATASTALSINGPSLSRAINTPNDLDWFKVTLDAGNLYTFRVEETTAGIGGIDPQIRLVDVSGNAIDGLVAAPAGVDTPFGNTELTFVSTVTGIYYVEVRDADFDGPSSAALFDDAEDTGTYQITATSMKEPAGPLSSSATLLGSDKYYTTFGTFAKAAYHLSTVTLANGKKAYVEKLHSDQILPADYVDTAPGVGIHGSGDNFVKAYANAAWESIAPTGPKA